MEKRNSLTVNVKWAISSPPPILRRMRLLDQYKMSSSVVMALRSISTSLSSTASAWSNSPVLNGLLAYKIH